MLILLAAAVGVAGALGLSLVLKLHAIRTRGFGEGSRLELPVVGLAFRHPHWWKLSGDRASKDGRETVILRTGHSRGLLRIAAWRENGEGGPQPVVPAPLLETGAPPGDSRGLAAPPPASSLQEVLALVLREQGIDLDDPEIKTAHGPTAPIARVWVASGGRQASKPEERTYFEAHLASISGVRVLFFYTNSILQGFLDAYYLEKVLETLQPAPFPR